VNTENGNHPGDAKKLSHTPDSLCVCVCVCPQGGEEKNSVRVV